MTAHFTEEIGPLQDTCKGRRVFVVGTGSSLDDINLKRLKGQYIFALNGAATFFKNVSLYPDAWWLWWDMRSYREAYSLLKDWRRVQTLTHKKGLEEMRGHRGAARFVCFMNRQQFEPRRTIVETAILLADFFGFNETILVGVDGFVTQNGKAYCDSIATWKKCFFCNPEKKGSHQKSTNQFLSAMDQLMPRIKKTKVLTTSKLYPGDHFEFTSFEEAVKRPKLARDEEAEKYRRRVADL